jgi:hypothetical protein
MAESKELLSKGESLVFEWKDFVVTNQRLIKKGDGFIYLDQLSGVRTRWTGKPKYLRYGIILFILGFTPMILEMLGLSSLISMWFAIDLTSIFSLISPLSMVFGTIIVFFSLIGIKMTDFCGPNIKFSVIGNPEEFIRKLNEVKTRFMK